jgi:di/tricarboxylate transporter
VVIGGMEAVGLMNRLFAWAQTMNARQLAVLTVVTATLSNLVSNVPAVLLLKSLIPSFAEPGRAWLVVAIASTLAGNLTIIGSVANLIVVKTAREARIEVKFLEYCRVGVPLTLITLLIGWLLLGVLPPPQPRTVRPPSQRARLSRTSRRQLSRGPGADRAGAVDWRSWPTTTKATSARSPRPTTS